MKDAEKKETGEAPKDEEKADEAAKPKGLSGGPFSAARAGGGWQARMQERELKKREQELSVDSTFAFPSLADAMSG